jgi:hypothetical protein
VFTAIQPGVRRRGGSAGTKMHAQSSISPCVDMLKLSQKGHSAETEAARELLEGIVERIGQTDGWLRMQMAVDGMLCTLENLKVEMQRLKKRPRPGGSKKGRVIIRRNFAAAYDTLWQQYFAENPVYSAVHFRRRFRISRNIFDKIYDACKLHPFFAYKANAALKMGIHPLVKVTAVLRHFAYGISADGLDDHYNMSETSLLNARIAFCDVRLLSESLPLTALAFLTPYAGSPLCV